MNATLLSLIASFIASVVAAIVVAYMTARAAGYSKNVTAERQKWREHIRRLTAEAFELMESGRTRTAEFRRLYTDFSTRLNPHDSRDQAILAFLRSHMTESPRSIRAELMRLNDEFTLRHDAREGQNRELLALIDLHLRNNPPLIAPQLATFHTRLSALSEQLTPPPDSYLKALIAHCMNRLSLAFERVKEAEERQIQDSHDFVQAISRLLKHDWDRAIWETKILRMPKFKNTIYPMAEIRDPDYNKKYRSLYKNEENDFIWGVIGPLIALTMALMTGAIFWLLSSISSTAIETKIIHEPRVGLALDHVERASPDAP